MSSYTISPEDFGLARASQSELAVSSVEESAAALRGVLDGAAGPKRDVAIANAAAALLAAGLANTLADGVALASKSIDGGAARRTLDALVELSQSLD